MNAFIIWDGSGGLKPSHIPEYTLRLIKNPLEPQKIIWVSKDLADPPEAGSVSAVVWAGEMA